MIRERDMDAFDRAEAGNALARRETAAERRREFRRRVFYAALAALVLAALVAAIGRWGVMG